jgi:hypothetical protein
MLMRSLQSPEPFGGDIAVSGLASFEQPGSRSSLKMLNKIK